MSRGTVIGWSCWSAFARRSVGPVGAARVIDGDTMVVADQLVRLHGIDAPELGQTFRWRDVEVECGTMALAALEALTAGIPVRCVGVERDRYGRLVARCYSPSGVDLGRQMVWAGWALAYRYYSLRYVDAEDAARRARRGLWRGTFMKPWSWRARMVRSGEPTAPPRLPA
jgi:endonuclease YncB( thermonuclease family)